MMENIKDQFIQYWDQIMAWYAGLSQTYQYGVMFLLVLVGLLVVSSFIISRVTK